MTKCLFVDSTSLYFSPHITYQSVVVCLLAMIQCKMIIYSLERRMLSKKLTDDC